MKTRFFTYPILLLVFTLLWGSCVKDDCTEEYTYINYEPIYKRVEDVRIPIRSEAARALENPGKIYFYNNYIFINELDQGIHVIDNANPASPQHISFIPIPGNKDISIKGDEMFVDSYMDLLSIDISNIQEVSLISRVENVYEYPQNEQGILIAYEEVEHVAKHDCNDDFIFLEDGNFNNSGAVFDANGPTPGATGIGGSFAAMNIYGSYLYLIDQREIKVFDISNPAHVVQGEQINAQLNAETAYVYKEYLFVGGQTGMVIFDLSNPAQPRYISGYDHQMGCDPVAVYGDYAYVTIHSDNACRIGSLNQLDVLDISTITSPELMRSFEMQQPKGITANEDALFLCEGEYGLKIFDNGEPLEVGERLLHHLREFDAYDVILLPNQANILLLIGKDGFYQFDISNPAQPVELSFIPV